MDARQTGPSLSVRAIGCFASGKTRKWAGQSDVLLRRLVCLLRAGRASVREQTGDIPQYLLIVPVLKRIPTCLPHFICHPAEAGIFRADQRNIPWESEDTQHLPAQAAGAE
jgi:hypothetical protein